MCSYELVLKSTPVRALSAGAEGGSNSCRAACGYDEVHLNVDVAEETSTYYAIMACYIPHMYKYTFQRNVLVTSERERTIY